MNKIERLNLLDSCLIEAICPDGKKEYINPQIFLNYYDENENISLYSHDDKVRVSADDLQFINGVPFSGNYEDLKTEINALVKSANCCCSGDSSTTNQAILDKLCDIVDNGVSINNEVTVNPNQIFQDLFTDLGNQIASEIQTQTLLITQSIQDMLLDRCTLMLDFKTFI